MLSHEFILIDQWVLMHMSWPTQYTTDKSPNATFQPETFPFHCT